MAGAAARPITPARVQRALREAFGLRRLREGQQPVIERVLAGLPTLAILPTGAGKSLCYQLPALLLPGLTVVVSPLIALIKDQCDALAALGIAAVQQHSSRSAAHGQAARAAIGDGSAQIVYTTPEQLGDAEFVGALAQAGVALLVVDEAHCISQWGFDFRPAFLDLGQLAPRLGDPAVLALTATATESVIDDIVRLLRIPKDGVIASAVYRPNLHLRAEHVPRDDDKLPRILSIVQGTAGCGLVYAATVKATHEIHAALEGAGESVGLYHGKLGAARRRASQDAFMAGEVRVMVATNAFGLGVDKPDVRFVVHYQIPGGLDAYYQEAGRAGRDGEVAQCTLLFAGADKAVQQFFLAGRYPEPADFEAVHSALRRDPPDPSGWIVDALVEALDANRRKTQVALGEMTLRGIVKRTPAGVLKLSGRGALDEKSMLKIAARLRERREQDRALLEAMVAYAQSGRCRWRALLDHFGQSLPDERCRTCDNCLRLSAHQAAPAAEADAPAASSESIRVSFAPGERVRTRRHGIGVVREADALSVTVEFENGAARCFAPQFVVAAAASSRDKAARAAA